MENQLATTAQKPLTIREHLEGDAFKREIAKALPRHLTPDRFLRIAITALTRTPKLKDCDQASFFQSLLTLSQLGIEPDGRRAHLIPFENRKRNCVECQLILDWKGLAELALRSGVISYLHGDVVREGDIFDYSIGEIRQHVPWFLRVRTDRPESAGEIYAAYAIAKMKDGTTKAEVMSIDEIDGIRRRSRAGQSGPWVTDFSEMAKKTAFRRLSKWLPLSPEIRDATEADDDSFEPIQVRDAKVSTVTHDDIPFDFGAPAPHVAEDAKPESETSPAQQPAASSSSQASSTTTTQDDTASACDRLQFKAENENIAWSAIEAYAKTKSLDANKDADAVKILRAWATIAPTLKKGGAK